MSSQCKTVAQDHEGDEGSYEDHRKHHLEVHQGRCRIRMMATAQRPRVVPWRADQLQVDMTVDDQDLNASGKILDATPIRSHVTGDWIVIKIPGVAQYRCVRPFEQVNVVAEPYEF